MTGRAKPSPRQGYAEEWPQPEDSGCHGNGVTEAGPATPGRGPSQAPVPIGPAPPLSVPDTVPQQRWPLWLPTSDHSGGLSSPPQRGPGRGRGGGPAADRADGSSQQGRREWVTAVSSGRGRRPLGRSAFDSGLEVRVTLQQAMSGFSREVGANRDSTLRVCGARLSEVPGPGGLGTKGAVHKAGLEKGALGRQPGPREGGSEVEDLSGRRDKDERSPAVRGWDNFLVGGLQNVSLDVTQLRLPGASDRRMTIATTGSPRLGGGGGLMVVG